MRTHHLFGVVGSNRDDEEPTNQSIWPGDGREDFGFGSLQYLAAAASRAAGQLSVRALNGILADSIVLHDLYRRCHSLARGSAQSQLRRLLDAHLLEQLEAIDQLIEGIETLGGTAITHGRGAAELTTVPQPSGRVRDMEGMLSWLAEVHIHIVAELRTVIEGPTRNAGARSIEQLLCKARCGHERQGWAHAKYLAESRRSVPKQAPRRHVNPQHPAGRGIR
jgi:starvation-inducible DNA-binding protein